MAEGEAPVTGEPVMWADAGTHAVRLGLWSGAKVLAALEGKCVLVKFSSGRPLLRSVDVDRLFGA